MVTPIPDSIRKVAKLLQTIPGVGEKTALRYALYLVTSPNAMLLGEAVAALPLSVHPCETCMALVEGEGCPFCARSSTVLCVVHRFVDLLAVERAVGGMRFFVLGKLLSPLDGVDQSDLPLAELRALTREASEVVLALPNSVDGEATALFLARSLEGVNVSRPARGLPHGGDLEFADQVTMQGAFKSRARVSA